MEKKKAFTLVELLVVIAILAILSTVAIVSYSNFIEKAEKSAASQQVVMCYREAYALAIMDDGIISEGESKTSDGFTFIFTNNGKDATVTVPLKFKYQSVTIENGQVVINGETVTPPSNPIQDPVNPEPNPVINVTSITLNKNNLNLTVGDNESLTATVLPNNATDKTVAWSVSPAGIVSVDNGNVIAISAGSATITATSGQQSVNCSVTVNNPAIYYSITNNSNHLTIVGPSSVQEEQPYIGNVTVEIGYNVIVTMGDQVIADAYTPSTPTNGTISIDEVNANIVINSIEALNLSTAPTNWVDNTRLGTSDTNTTRTLNGCEVTNIFEAQENDTIYLYNFVLYPDSTKTAVTQMYNTSYDNPYVLSFTKQWGLDNGQITDLVENGNWMYFTVHCYGTTNNNTATTKTFDQIRISGALLSGKTTSDVLIYIWRNNQWVTE